MNRPSAPSDFVVDVDDVGHFVFGRRTRRDNFRIAAEYHRLTEGTNPTGNDFALEAEAQATLSTLLVDGPPGFAESLLLDNPDPMDPEAVLRMIDVFLALRKKELSFRPGSNEEGKGSREGDGKRDGVLVSPEVQPAAD